MRAPFLSARGSLGVRELLLLRLEGADGHVGFGEAAPLPHYDGVRIDDVRAALEDCRGLLSESDGTRSAELLAACAPVAAHPQAVAAIDLALWDLAGRRAGAPVWQLLGAVAPDPLEVNWTITAAEPAEAEREAAAAHVAGFRSVKVKVGLGDDTARLAAVRAAAGPQMEIRIDANGAWSVDQARAALDALVPVGIELCEEPASSLEAIAEVSASATVRIAIDETAGQPGALDRRVCDVACLKLARCGGISGVTDAARRARAVGYEVYLASTLDGPVGIAAALHSAAVVRPERPCGLATLELFDRRPEVLPVRGGRLATPAGPGLGDGLLAWYAS